jgi:hypothetical protein
MRVMPRGVVTSRGVARGLGIGGVLAAVVSLLVWSQGFIQDYATAFSLESAGPWTGRIPEPDQLPVETPSGRSGPAAPHDDSATAQPSDEPRFPQAYFEARYYGSVSASHVSTPAVSDAKPWLEALGSLQKIALPAALVPAVDFSSAAKLSVPVAASVFAPPAPAWRLANTGPFHVFVTSDNVSSTSSAATAAPSAAFPLLPGGGIPGVSSVGEPAGSLLRKR